MDLMHMSGRDKQNLGAVLLPPIVTLDIQVHRLDPAAGAARRIAGRVHLGVDQFRQ